MNLAFYDSLAARESSIEELQSYLCDPEFYRCPGPALFNLGEHSQLIDEIIKIRSLKMEKSYQQKGMILFPQESPLTWGPKLHAGRQTRFGLHPQTLQTSYHECLQVWEWLRIDPSASVVDLGAGYGRLGFVIHFLGREMSFRGIEYMLPRVNEGNRIYGQYGCDRAQLVHGDLTVESFNFPDASAYFLFDFGSPSDINKILKKLLDPSNIGKKLILRGREANRLAGAESKLYRISETHLVEPMGLYVIR